MDDFVDPFNSVASLADANLHEGLPWDGDACASQLHWIFPNESSGIFESDAPKLDLGNVASDEILTSRAQEEYAQVPPHHSVLPNSNVRYGMFGQEDQMQQQQQQQHHIQDYISHQNNGDETSSLYLQALANLQSSSSISQLPTTTTYPAGVSATSMVGKSGLQSSSYVGDDSAANLPNSDSREPAANLPGVIIHNDGPPKDAIAVAKPRARAKRGQATDPHSISERHRREKISERMKNLQELVPNSNKANKASMLDEIIEYVKFLQLQVKVLSMSRLGETGVVMPLMTGIPSKDMGNLDFPSAAMEPDELETQEGIAMEEEVVKLMESNVTAAMQFLQDRGFCLMPVALASAISSRRKASSSAIPPKKLERIRHSVASDADGLSMDGSEK